MIRSDALRYTVPLSSLPDCLRRAAVAGIGEHRVLYVPVERLTTVARLADAALLHLSSPPSNRALVETITPILSDAYERAIATPGRLQDLGFDRFVLAMLTTMSDDGYTVPQLQALSFEGYVDLRERALLSLSL